MEYPVIIYPAEEGGFVAEIIAFPGCLAQGETFQECFEEIETVSKLWIEEYLKTHAKLPDSNGALNKLIEFNKAVYA